MIKKTLCFSNPAYLSLRDAQLVIKLPEVEKAANLTEDFKKSTEVTRLLRILVWWYLTASKLSMQVQRYTNFLANHNLCVVLV